MMSKFIYALNESAKNHLLETGFTLIAQVSADVYMFYNDGGLTFEKHDGVFYSDTMVF